MSNIVAVSVSGGDQVKVVLVMGIATDSDGDVAREQIVASGRPIVCAERLSGIEIPHVSGITDLNDKHFGGGFVFLAGVQGRKDWKAIDGELSRGVVGVDGNGFVVQSTGKQTRMREGHGQSTVALERDIDMRRGVRSNDERIRREGQIRRFNRGGPDAQVEKRIVAPELEDGQIVDEFKPERAVDGRRERVKDITRLIQPFDG